MKLGRGILKHSGAPLAVAFHSDERLNRVAVWLEVRLPGHHHACDRAQDSDFGIQKAHTSDLPHKRTGAMVVKDLPVDRSNLGSPLELRAIPSDGVSIFGE